MQEFSFTPEQNYFRTVCRDFLESEILPSISRHDLEESFPEENVKLMAEQGLFGIPIPERYGGAGMGEVEYGIMLEELGRICAAHGTIVGAHTSLCETSILLFGSEEQRKRYLPPLARGEVLGAFALTEPSAGSDAEGIRTSATLKGDHYILNGSKAFCSNGDRAGTIIVLAVTDPSLKGRGGITAFIVESETHGLHVGRVERKLGIRASSTAQLFLEDCPVPKENVLGEVGAGLAVALTVLDGGRAGLSAGSVGGCGAIIDYLVNYLAGEQDADQSTQFAIADMAMGLQAARSLAYQSLSLVDRYYAMILSGELVPREFRDRVSTTSAMAKTFTSESLTRSLEMAVELCPLQGIVEGGLLERSYRDSFVSEIYEGTNEIQRLVIARDLLDSARRAW